MTEDDILAALTRIGVKGRVTEDDILVALTRLGGHGSCDGG